MYFRDPKDRYFRRRGLRHEFYTANVVDPLRRQEKEQVGACTTPNLDKRDLPGS